MSRQLPNLWAASDCALCGGAASGAPVCEECVAALPRSSLACGRCALPIPNEGLCGECLRRPPRFDAAFAAFEYRFPVDRLLQRFKFAADLAMGRWLGQHLASRLPSSADLLVAPPLPDARLRGRGFNQSVEIARTISAVHGLRHVHQGLARSRATPPQAGLGRAERRRNLRDAFECRLDLSGLHVAIVDDVLTTGATADALAATLKRCGAHRVSVWVVARTPGPGAT